MMVRRGPDPIDLGPHPHDDYATPRRGISGGFVVGQHGEVERARQKERARTLAEGIARAALAHAEQEARG